jgi:hypothetical protein
VNQTAEVVRRDRSPWIFSIGVLVFMLRVVGPLWRGGIPSFFPDSASFLKVARIGPFAPSFWFSERPVGMPLIYWLVGFDVRWLVVVQSLAYALAVVLVISTLLRLLDSRPLAWLGGFAVTLIAIQPRFAVWSVEALSESIGLTTSMVAIVCWLRHGHSPSRRSMIAATIATIAWLLTRDSHGLPVVVIVVILAVTGWRCRDATVRRTALRCALAMSICFTYVTVSQGVSERNQYPLMNNVGLRILPDDSMTDSFVGKGMPMSETLLDRTGRNTWDDGEAFLVAPELEGFRSWVRGSGQFDQVTSLVTDAPFWIDVVRRELPGALRYDFVDYDRFGVGERLPGNSWFAGIDSTASLWWFVLLAALSIWVIVRRSRLLALILGTGLVAGLVELYASIATDAVEVQRHTVGPVFRINLLCLLSIVLAIDVLLRRKSVARKIVRDSWAHITAGASVALMAIAWFALERRSQDYDPQFARTIVERAARLGGTYYENGLHNKGPLEMVVYDSARLFTSYDTYWFAIAAYCIAISMILGATAWAVTRRYAGQRTAAAVAAAVTIAHFAVSSSDYTGVVYSRNITTALLAGVTLIAVFDRAWIEPRRARSMWIVSFVMLGLAIQTLLTTVFAAVAVVILIVALRRRTSGFERPLTVGAITLATTVLSAPAWYAIRGSFDEFWSGWWTYASFMSAGTGRGYMEQFGLGWNTMIDYYSERPESVFIVLAFITLAWVRRHRFDPLQRVLTFVLLGWFVGGWIELILGQRYSSHYFSVIAVPTALMFAALIASMSPLFATIGRWCTESREPNDRRVAHAPVLLALLLTLATQCADLFWDGAARAGNFRSFATETSSQQSGIDGQSRTVRAVLDLTSNDGDPLLAWTMYPWTYLNNERVPATRFSWKSFLLGEIYLGRTSDEYVLPRTWEWFGDDIERTKPTAYVRPLETALVGETPFADLLNTEFTPVFTGTSVEVSLRDDVWSDLIGFDGTPDTRAVIDDGTCWRWRGSISELGDDAVVGFSFSDGEHETVHMSVSSERVWSSSDTVEFFSVPRLRTDSTNADIILLVGARSAVLVVDNAVLAGVRLSGESTMSLSDPSGIVNDAHVAPMPELAECVNS